MTEQIDNKNLVSVFLGVVPTAQLFEDYITEHWNEEGDETIPTCPFWTDLGVSWLDHDFQDAHYQGTEPVSIHEFLSNPFSYIDSFREMLLDSCSQHNITMVNTGIFVYNFQYPEKRVFPSQHIHFLGCFSYHVSNPEWFTKLLET